MKSPYKWAKILLQYSLVFQGYFPTEKGALKTVIFRATLLKGNDSSHSQLVREQVMGLEITANLCALS